jgi:glycosyltransferase involved in cell wall biosynthesis
MERQLSALGCPSGKVFYNPCGVEVDKFTGGSPGTTPPLFLAAGRFVDKKAPHLTLLAFEKVARQQPAARLVMIGDGALWEACRQLVGALRLDSRVQFLGNCRHEEVACWMRRARAFVQHSLTPNDGDSEGTPVAILEAGASGLPVVSTRHAGIADVVVEGETGLLVEERDVEGMANHMLRLAQDADLAALLGANARRHIATHFSMEQSIGRLFQILGTAALRRPLEIRQQGENGQAPT